MKTVVKYTMLILLGVFLLYPIKLWIQTGSPLYDNSIVECGIIIEKEKPDTIKALKYNAKVTVEEYFVIRYEDRIERMNPSTNDYYSHKVGDRICYRNTPEMSTKEILLTLWSLVGGIIDVILVLIVVVIAIIALYEYAFDKKL